MLIKIQAYINNKHKYKLSIIYTEKLMNLNVTTQAFSMDEATLGVYTSKIKGKMTNLYIYIHM